MSKTNHENLALPRAKWWLYFVCAAAIPLAIGGYLLKKNAEATPIERQAAGVLGVPAGSLHDLGEITDKAERTHQLSESDWERVSQAFHEENQKILAIGPFMFLGPEFAHKSEAESMLKQYLSEGHKDGNVAAVDGLRKFDDPSWKGEATKLMNSTDPAVRNPAQQLFSKYLK